MKNRITPMIVSAALAASVIGSSSALAESGKAEYGSLTVTVYNEDEGGLYTDEHTSFMICGGPDEHAAPGMAGAVFLCDVTPSESNPFVMNDIYISDNFKYTIVDTGSPDYDGFNYRIDYERSDRTFKFTENPDQDLSIYMKKNYFVVSSDKSVTVATHGQDIADNVWTVIHQASELINSDDFKALDTADRISEAKELMKSLSDEELIADYAFDAENNVMNFTYKHGTITGQLRPAVFEDEHKQLTQNGTADNTEEISYKIVRLPDKVEYKLGESISLKGIQVEMKNGDEEPVVYTYPDVAFDYQSNIPKAPTVILHSDFRSDKAGTYKVEVVGADNVSFDVKVVDDTSLSDTTGTFPVTVQTVVTATTTAADPEIKDPAVFTEGEMMTLDDVIELSKKGKALTLKDFAKFKGVIAGSGILILEYDFGGGCFLTVGSIEPYHIDYAILRYPGCEKSIDIRTDDVEAYLAEMKAKNDPAANNGKKKMTLYDVMEFARMGDILDWSDFDEYVGEDGWHGTGMYTHTYSFDLGDGFVLYVGGNQPARPETIFLYRYDPENGMDIREEGINNFIYITADQLMNVEVLEVNGDTLLVRADDCSGELLTLPTKYLDSDVVPKAGMKLEVTYVGGILQTYPAQFGEVKKVSVIQNGIPMDGDANCDGSVDLADAILIMQALANPNKYGIDGTAEHHLTSLGRIKADMDGNGLTVDDALAIQLKLLGLSDNAADPDITVFGLAPSKTGVKEFLADNPTVKSSYQGDELFNVTPEEITDRYNFRIFKYSSDCESYLEYNGKTYHIGTGFGGPGTVSFAVADIDANNSPELYFTYSFGSGIHASDIGYFDFATETVSELEFYYERGLTDQGFDFELRDLAFVVNNNRLEIYSAAANGNSFVNLEVELKEKLGEITLNNGAIKAAEQSIDSSLIANKLFIYEKEGFGGDFYITFNEDGTFMYSPGVLSSYLGG